MRAIFLTIVFIFLAFALLKNSAIQEKEYAMQVLDQYIKYYCPQSGTCTRRQALRRIRKDWPAMYNLEFNILDDEQK